MDKKTERFLQNLGRQVEKEIYKVRGNQVDPRAQREMDKFYETKIKKAMKTGEIPPPSEDKWMKQHQVK